MLPPPVQAHAPPDTQPLTKDLEEPKLILDATGFKQLRMPENLQVTRSRENERMEF